ncbi:hypothetical protein CVD28_01785 [Bacillus sp. M6-12]|uniref:hypothetical protein n=1 Tax=Bacillus sp. M6-12 TaxID=2054166 RepID=UPI000C763689|nr:hypothetical protein [Bacillus sp. M6-12]PLS19163.1 hypothetical protein CVD28_01785 [Bacillus sp. M6-12]
MDYTIEVFQDFKGFGGRCIYYGCDSIEKVKDILNHLKANEKVLSIEEHHLVYQHPIYLPICNETTIYSRREIYREWVKVPKEQVHTAKQKDYKQNFLEKEGFNNYCIKYEVLTEDKYEEYIYKVGATYDLRNSDRQAIMKALYDHSKSNRMFNLRLFQYRKLSLEEFLRENR